MGRLTIFILLLVAILKVVNAEFERSSGISFRNFLKLKHLSSSEHSVIKNQKHPHEALFPGLSTLKGGYVPTDGEDTSTVSESVVNLVKNVAGAGMLSLAAGMAAGTGWLPALLICIVLGVLSAHTFSMIGHSSYYTGETDFKGICTWTIGKHYAWITDSSIALMNFAGGIIYAGILGDVITPLLQAAGLPSAFNRRWLNILIVSGFVLTPLSLLEKLSFLKYTSFLGVLSVLYTVVFMFIRAFDGSYEVGSRFYNELSASLQPSFENESLWRINFSSLVLIANLSLAYIAHFNAPRYYAELRNRTPKRFDKTVSISFFILILIHAGAMIAGYETFGDNCRSNITLNYHPQDLLAMLARVAVGFSIMFSYPLEFIGMRDAYLGACKSFLLLMPTSEQTSGGKALFIKKVMVWSTQEENFKKLSVILLSMMTVIAAVVQDIGLAVGVSGALFGALTVYIIPSLVYYHAKIKYAPQTVTFWTKWILLYVPFGAAVGLFGTGMTIYEFLIK